MNQTKVLIDELKQQGITHEKVLEAIQNVPREAFTLPQDEDRAYENTALGFHCQQTISQPYIVALMTQALYQHPSPQKILEIGTGSGYQSAILAYLFKSVYSVERIKYLHDCSKQKLAELGLNNVHLKWADGYTGWVQEAPFDGILVTACADSLPDQLIAQLSENGGVLICPIQNDEDWQKLVLVKKIGNDLQVTNLEYVSFVPMLKGTQDKDQGS